MRDPHADEKRRLRALLLERRRRLGAEERRERGGRIACALRRIDEYARARHIMFYAAVRGEVETRDLICERLSGGMPVSVPCVDPSGGSIYAAGIDDFACDLAPGCYGIPEPCAGRRRETRASDIDLFIVPGVGFDWSGARLGWGKGFYDAFLASANPGALKIGLAYEFQLLPRIAERKADVPVDMVVTEDRVVDCRKIRKMMEMPNIE